MAHRVAPDAEADLDDIWLHVARESGSIEIADRLVDTITERFFVLASFPFMGRSRDEDLGPHCRSLAIGEYVIVHCVENDAALILRVVHGRRDLDTLFGQ